MVTDTDGSVLMYYGYTYGRAGEKVSATEAVRESADDTDIRVIYMEYGYGSLSRLTGEVVHVRDDAGVAGLDFADIRNTTWSGNIAYQYAYDSVSNRTSKAVAVMGNVCGIKRR